jgi:hypothetical protein
MGVVGPGVVVLVWAWGVIQKGMESVYIGRRELCLNGRGRRLSGSLLHAYTFLRRTIDISIGSFRGYCVGAAAGTDAGTCGDDAGGESCGPDDFGHN